MMNWEEDDRKRPAVERWRHDVHQISPKKQRTANNNNNNNINNINNNINNGNKKNKFHLHELSLSKLKGMRYSDEVHLTVDFCPVMQALMDTRQFQRLRYIKQLGTTYMVYATGNHTRFEHSVGVAYLAQRMARRIKSFQQETLGTTEKDVLCVTLAGLLHDIGHGPFSHAYEEFRNEIDKDIQNNPELEERYNRFPQVRDGWSHEDSSLVTIDAALESLGLQIDLYNLDQPLKQIGDGIDARSMRVFHSSVLHNVDIDTTLDTASNDDNDNDDNENILTSRDWIFIKECIYGKPIPEVMEKLGLHSLIGREKPKQEWLYNVVSNSYNGIDIDKVDYFARDERRSLAEVGNIKIPIVNEARVALANCSNDRCERCNNGGRHYMICYPKKCVEGVMAFFAHRYKMHTTVYQHKTVTASGCMLIDILKKADLHYLIPTSSNNNNHSNHNNNNDNNIIRLPISRAVVDNTAFCRLTDSIVEKIADSTSEELRPARELAQRFLDRKLYKFVGEKLINFDKNPNDRALWKEAKENPEVIASEIARVPGKHTDQDGQDVLLDVEDIIVQYCSWHYGAKDKNPLSNVRFIDRDDLNGPIDDPVVAHPVDESDYLTCIPRAFEKKVIRVFCRNPYKADLLAHKFEHWIYEPKSCFANTPAAAAAGGGSSLFVSQKEDEEHDNNNNNHDDRYGNGYAAAAAACGNPHHDPYHDNANYGGPVQLSQDSDYEDAMSPIKPPPPSAAAAAAGTAHGSSSHDGNDNGNNDDDDDGRGGGHNSGAFGGASPIPIPRFRGFASM